MSEEYNITLSKKALELIFLQAHQAMHLDYRQHSLLTPERQAEDAADFLERQTLRFTIMAAVKKTLAQEFSIELLPHYTDAESIMLFARGLSDGECGGAETAVT